VKDGLAASREILAHYAQLGPRHVAPVIIAMTASAMEADRKLCQQAGLVDFVAKPINGAALVDTIRKWAERIKTARAAVAAATGSASLPITGAPVTVGGLSPLTPHLPRPRLIANKLPTHAATTP